MVTEDLSAVTTLSLVLSDNQRLATGAGEVAQLLECLTTIHTSHGFNPQHHQEKKRLVEVGDGAWFDKESYFVVYSKCSEFWLNLLILFACLTSRENHAPSSDLVGFAELTSETPSSSDPGWERGCSLWCLHRETWTLEDKRVGIWDVRSSAFHLLLESQRAKIAFGFLNQTNHSRRIFDPENFQLKQRFIMVKKLGAVSLTHVWMQNKRLQCGAF